MTHLPGLALNHKTSDEVIWEGKHRLLLINEGWRHGGICQHSLVSAVDKVLNIPPVYQEKFKKIKNFLNFLDFSKPHTDDMFQLVFSKLKHYYHPLKFSLGP